jgi:7-cyano-7-deazaguanine synthase
VSVPSADPVAVLASGGADSAVLVVESARPGGPVHPVYIRFGLAWEAVEEAHLRRFLATVADPTLDVRPLVVLDLPIRDVYGGHWSVSGVDVPDDTTPDDAVYLPGRNLLLLAKTSVWCALHGIESVRLGTLAGNPFSDSTPEFFAAFGAMAEQAHGRRLVVSTPFASMSKAEVLHRGRDLALELTFSCIAPVADAHCGLCNKCAERRKAFADAGIPDGTPYASA